MTTFDRTFDRPPTRRRSDEIQFRLIYGATLPAFLLGVLAQRLLAHPSRRPSGASASGLSVFGEARAAARTCGSFALMG